MVILNKRGMYFWIELIFLIIIITIVVLSLPKSQDGFLKAKDSFDLEKLGFGTLQNLDQSHILENFTSTTNFTASNFTAMSKYIEKSLPSTISTEIEYFNGTACFSEGGALVGSCGNFTIYSDTVVTNYVFARTYQPITIKLYLRRIFS